MMLKIVVMGLGVRQVMEELKTKPGHPVTLEDAVGTIRVFDSMGREVCISVWRTCVHVRVCSSCTCKICNWRLLVAPGMHVQLGHRALPCAGRRRVLPRPQGATM